MTLNPADGSCRGRPGASSIFFIMVVALTAPTNDHAGTPDLIVHEWGTFTSFQDDGGASIAGINVDDEPVPSFVHGLPVEIFAPDALPARWSQGAPRCHPGVTLRLETPVLYFYPQSHAALPALTVTVSFRGGWFSEFFPNAYSEADMFPKELTAQSRSLLRWAPLELNPANAPDIPRTDEHVWLAPRNVQSALVSAPREGEAEKYLFYRGVGHIDAPLVVTQREGSIHIAARDHGSATQLLAQAWLVHVVAVGDVRYRRIEPDASTLPLPAEAGSLDGLRKEIADAVVAQGLYEDEAQAMLDTWRLSYFDSTGLRLLFLLPHAWTDARMPLTISTPADIIRVMMGRIELISPQQRQSIEQLLALPASALPPQALYYGHPEIMRAAKAGGQSAGLPALYRQASVEVPQALLLYESLGRFRDAQLAHAWRTTTDAARRTAVRRVMDNFSACTLPDD